MVLGFLITVTKLHHMFHYHKKSLTVHRTRMLLVMGEDATPRVHLSDHWEHGPAS